ncbi:MULTISPECIES: head-tail connector protein [Helcococcus]|uniref:head-tail connector protein n=1 Tax=Helcococcus TaxID=31983 RepID=UPI0038B74E09
MKIDLESVKNYLRVDFEDDDLLIASLIESSKNLCMDILRTDNLDMDSEIIKTAILYSVAFLYEHREEANHKELTLTLRALLFGLRKAEF